MKTTISQFDFIDGFRRAGRATQFTRGALCILFDYFEQLEEDLGEEMEYDPIGICCEYAEDTAEGIVASYGIPIEPDDNPDGVDYLRNVVDYLEDEGAYIGTTDADTIIYRLF